MLVTSEALKDISFYLLRVIIVIIIIIVVIICTVIY